MSADTKTPFERAIKRNETGMANVAHIASRLPELQPARHEPPSAVNTPSGYLSHHRQPATSMSDVYRTQAARIVQLEAERDELVECLQEMFEKYSDNCGLWSRIDDKTQELLARIGKDQPAPDKGA